MSSPTPDPLDRLTVPLFEVPVAVRPDNDLNVMLDAPNMAFLAGWLVGRHTAGHGVPQIVREMFDRWGFTTAELWDHAE